MIDVNVDWAVRQAVEVLSGVSVPVARYAPSLGGGAGWVGSVALDDRATAHKFLGELIALPTGHNLAVVARALRGDLQRSAVRELSGYVRRQVPCKHPADVVDYLVSHWATGQGTYAGAARCGGASEWQCRSWYLGTLAPRLHDWRVAGCGVLEPVVERLYMS